MEYGSSCSVRTCLLESADGDQTGETIRGKNFVDDRMASWHESKTKSSSSVHCVALHVLQKVDLTKTLRIESLPNTAANALSVPIRLAYTQMG